MDYVIHCTAWDLIGKYSHYWSSGRWDIFTKTGRTVWEDAQLSKTGSIRLARLVVGQTVADGIKQINKYVSPETPITLLHYRPEYGLRHLKG